MRVIERVVHDIRYAARGLRRSPGFTLTAVVVLALGIGANTAVFSVAKDILLRPLPYPESDRLVQYIGQTRTGKIALQSEPRFNWWRERLRGHEGITAYYGGGPGVTLVDRDRREHVAAMYVSWHYFRVFRAPVLFGRAFDRADDQPQGPRVAIVSQALALRWFGAGQHPVGRTLRLGDADYEVVGVMAAAFQPIPAAEIWFPLQAPRVSFNHTAYLTVVGRLLPHTSVENAMRAAAESTMPFRQMFPDAMAPYEDFAAEPLERMVAGDSRSAVQLLIGAVFFVLLIACANAANLFVARASKRKGDLATRAALGAPRGRLIRQLFAECVILALAGGAVGLAVGFAGMRALIAAVPGALVGRTEVTTDSRVLLFTLGVSALTALTFGLLPALRASRVDLSSALNDSAAEATTNPAEHRRQSLLVVVEMTLAIVLLVGAGLLIRTFLEQRRFDRGFRSTGVLTFDQPLNGGSFSTGVAVNELVRDVKRRLDGAAGMRAVAATYALPVQPTISFPFTLLDRPLFAAPYHGLGDWRSVSPDYFSVFGIRLLRGRLLEDADDEKALRVVVINRAMAWKFWQYNDPIGQKLIIGKATDREFDDGPRIVVGVVSDVRGSLNGNLEPMLYVPIAQTGDRIMARNNRFAALTWAVRTNADGATLRANIERELRDASRGLLVSRVQRIEDIIRATTAQLEFTAILLGVFAAAALVLASVGLYGLMAYSVEQRRQEIGIRLALGAEPWALRNMVLRQGGQLTAIGVAAGVGAAYLLMQTMASIVVGMAAWDTTVVAAVAGLLAAVSLLAAYFPAQNATRTDPLNVLRRS